MRGGTVETGLPSRWLADLDDPSGPMQRAFDEIYGPSSSVQERRRALLRRAVECFLRRFGDRPVRIFRAPARINLRGMHVDTHGGYLNLMTHDRETLVVAAPTAEPLWTFANVDPAFEEVSFSARPQEEDRRPRGHWGRYIRGAALQVWRFCPDVPPQGMEAVVASDIPFGAALSSSAALCVATVGAGCALLGRRLDAADWIQAARDAEWHAGSRCGVSDPAAVILGAAGTLVNVALREPTLDTASARCLPFPRDLAVLVAHSHTRRSLSGAALVEYTRNRFAYSLALEVFRQALLRRGLPPADVSAFDRLSRFTTAVAPHLPAPAALYGVLREIPEEIDWESLRAQYDLPDLRESYERYFGALPEDERPRRLRLRGPLLFGLAESERARIFPDRLAEGDYEGAGRLMTLGHDGDRRVTAEGEPFDFPVDDDALAEYARAERPLIACPGEYGASSPVLDALVDAALAAGALGACLTGAGIAGAVLALCRADCADAVADALRARMVQPDYARLARLDRPLTPREVENAVVVNTAVAGAGEWGRP